MRKYVIKNCPQLQLTCTFNVCGNAYGSKYLCGDGRYECQDCTNCTMKRIVELCSKAHGQIIGYEKGKIYDGKNLIEANLPLTTINPLAKEILVLLDIEERE